MSATRPIAQGAAEGGVPELATPDRGPSQLPGLLVVAFAVFASAATSRAPATGDLEACGPLGSGASANATCTQREECTEVCCLCDNGAFSYIARGCDLDEGVCYDELTLCDLALEEDPSLCEAEDAGPVSG